VLQVYYTCYVVALALNHSSGLWSVPTPTKSTRESEADNVIESDCYGHGRLATADQSQQWNGNEVNCGFPRDQVRGRAKSHAPIPQDLCRRIS
jgi:hypothetical protein